MGKKREEKFGMLIIIFSDCENVRVSDAFSCFTKIKVLLTTLCSN